MDILTLLISRVNDVLWTYILIIMLLGCAFWFTFKTNFVQFRMIREMIRLLCDSRCKTEGIENQLSSFQSFDVSIASTGGTEFFCRWPRLLHEKRIKTAVDGSFVCLFAYLYFWICF